MLVVKNKGTTGGAPAPVPAPIAQPSVVRPTPAPVAQVPTPPPSPIPAPRPVVAAVTVQVPTPAVVVPTRPTQSLVVAQQPTQQLAQRTSAPALPSFVEAAPEGEIAAGFENVGNEAYKMPMLSIAQAQSPQVMGSADGPGTMKAGDAYLTTDRERPFFPATQPVEVLPFFYYKSYDRWNHRDLGGGLVESSVDPMGSIAREAAKQLKDYRTNPQPTAAEQPFRSVESIVFLVLFKDTDETTGTVTYVPVAIPFAKSKYKKAVNWIQIATKASQGGRFPMYGTAYEIKTVFEKGKRGSFYNFDVDFAANAITQEDYNAAKEAYQQFTEIYKQRKLQIQQEDDQTPEVEIVGAVPAVEPSKAY